MKTFEEAAKLYVELIFEGCLDDAKEVIEGYQAGNGWGPAEEEAIEAMLDGAAPYPAGEPEFNEGLFRFALKAPFGAAYKYDAMAKAYVALCRAGREDLAEELATCGRNYIFAGPGAGQEFNFAVERFEDVTF